MVEKRPHHPVKSPATCMEGKGLSIPKNHYHRQSTGVSFQMCKKKTVLQIEQLKCLVANSKAPHFSNPPIFWKRVQITNYPNIRLYRSPEIQMARVKTSCREHLHFQFSSSQHSIQKNCSLCTPDLQTIRAANLRHLRCRVL